MSKKIGEIFGMPIMATPRWKIFMMRFMPWRYKRIMKGAYFDTKKGIGK